MFPTNLSHLYMKETPIPGSNAHGELDLYPSSSTHQKLLTFLQYRFFYGRRAMEQRHGSWSEVDKSIKFFISPEFKKNLSEQGYKQKPLQVVYPYSFALLDTFTSYIMMTLNKTPMFRYDAVEPGDVANAAMLELIVNQLASKNNVALPMQLAIRNMVAYGTGIASPVWHFDKKNYGCALENVQPQSVLPDPSTPMNKIADAEFVCWYKKVSYVELMARSYESPDRFINSEFLKSLIGAVPFYISDAENQTRLAYTHGLVDNSIYVVSIYVKLIPADVGIGSSKRPELWLFEVANNEIIILAQKMDLSYDNFPVSVCAENYDDSTIFPASRLEIVQGLQSLLDWSLTSRIANVRHNVQGRYIVDKSIINIKALVDGSPFVDTLKPIGNRRLDEFFKQLQTTDVTANQYQLMEFIIDGMQKIVGVDGIAAGQFRTSGPERLTSAEANATTAGATNRFDRVSDVVNRQFMIPISRQFAHYVQDYLDDEMWMRIPGRYAELLNSPADAYKKINRKDLDIAFDVKVGSASSDKSNDILKVKELVELIRSTPELLQKYDIEKIIDRLFIKEGIKDIADLKVSAVAMPDGQVAEQVKQGNLIGLEQSYGQQRY